ncbi:hypothetical protein [Microbacterium sp. NPDC080220]|uniref:hypothetical protein n=1 Tax=Microbacterium sp. NPDC080220 TaxID=3161017 RepID=UPI00343B3E45
MNPDDEFPRLHGQAIDPAVLAEEGEPFADLVSRHRGESFEVPQPNGWRVLRRRGESVGIGAPFDAERTLWHLASVRPGEEVWFIDEPEPLRASLADRRRGLELRWPDAVRRDAAPDGFAVDIVNTGDTRWVPDGDGFHVVGTVALVGDESFYVGWATMGGPRAVPLDSGEYARVPVQIDRSSWATLAPGEYDLHALLVPLMVRSEPLRIQVSAQAIERVQMAGRSRDGDRHRRAMEDDLRRQRVLLDATSRLADIGAAIDNTSTEEEALAAIEALLGVGPAAAREVFRASVSDLHESSAVWRRERVAETEQKLAD